MDLSNYVSQRRNALDRIAAKAGWRIVGWTLRPMSAGTGGPLLVLAIEAASTGAALSKDFNAGLMREAVGVDILLVWPDEVVGTEIQPW